jgi:glutamate--cysteine ligase
VAKSGEAPLCALVRGGIEYIEVRCVDISPFSPVGLDPEQIRFLDTFLLYCLLEESPPCDDNEQAVQTANLEAVVSSGRQPGLLLNSGAGEIPMDQWSRDLLSAMHPIATLLDSAHESAQYCASLDNQLAKIEDPELTPSARVLREMRERKLPFFKVAMAYSEQWSRYFRERPLAAETQIAFEEETRRSLQAQREIELCDEASFELYLDKFFAQYKTL